ncbi:hypothetical protein B0T18DRAFT_447216 [Schizothecium vesticola]|uniref:LysM domain-containing protein n=1 Tax=Schizothecium vesticola TaxID=314040 RepID=A0AA40EWF3_9PEZI|nr:hypothetical protein B0T18DRAFT_447216 [Schizothecium vesticola]
MVFPRIDQPINMFLFQQPSKTASSTCSTKTISRVGVLLLGSLFQLAGAQQFSDLQIFTIPYDVRGLSNACTDVLNTRVSCDLDLARSTNFEILGSVDVLDPVSLEKICVPKCRDNLQDLRTKIESTCNKQTDLITYENTIYPSTFIVDNYIHKWDVSCYKDKKSGQPCDLYLWGLRNESKDPDMCSDCILGVFAVQLSSPLGYDNEYVDQFSSIKAQCGTAAANYTYTKTTYTTSTVSKTPAKTTTTAATTTSEAGRPLKCDRKYTVSQGDTCESIALAQNTSTSGGGQICLPSPCTPYQVALMDTCRSIVNRWSATVDEIVAWNPIFTSKCTNIEKWRGFVICVRRVPLLDQAHFEVDGTNIMHRVGTSTGPTTVRTITTAKPTTTMSLIPWKQRTKPPAPGTMSNCTAWYNA